MNCPDCGNENDELDNYCRKCGNPLGTSTRPLLESIVLPTVPIGTNPKDQSEKKANAKRMGPNVDLRLVGRASGKFALVLGLFTLIVQALSIYLARLFGVTDEAASNQVDIIVSFLQAVIAGLFLLFFFSPLRILHKGKLLWSEIAQDTFRQFLTAWSAIWLTWVMLYLYIGIVLLINIKIPMPNVSLQITVDFLNVSNSAVFFYMFFVLDMPRVFTETEEDRKRLFRQNIRSISLICLLVFLLSSLGRFMDGTKFELGIYLSGILVALSMAYVFGRLDSHYMNVKWGMLAGLYLYAIIQVIGPRLVDFSRQDEPPYKMLFFPTALILKVYLFYVVNHWLQNGSFEKYFIAASNSLESNRLKKKGLRLKEESSINYKVSSTK